MCSWRCDGNLLCKSPLATMYQPTGWTVCTLLLCPFWLKGYNFKTLFERRLLHFSAYNVHNIVLMAEFPWHRKGRHSFTLWRWSMALCLSSVFSVLQCYAMKSGFITRDAEILLAKGAYTGFNSFCGPIAIIVAVLLNLWSPWDHFNKESLFSNDSVGSRWLQFFFIHCFSMCW